MTSKNDRREFRFDPDEMAFWPIEVQRKTRTNRARVTVLEYVENTGARMPTRSKKPGAVGGKFTSRRFKVRTNDDGRIWFGQCKNGTDIVRLRPADE